MFSDSRHTIFDNVKAHKIISGNIPEIEVDVKPFHINKDKLDTHLIDSVYKEPTFSFKVDNELMDFYGYPDISLSSNPEYRYKYPKLSEEEFSRQMRQTEEGTPNELNRFLRQDQTGQTIENIKEKDDAYEEGLKEINRMIDDETNYLNNLNNRRVHNITSSPYHKEYNESRLKKLNEQKEQDDRRIAFENKMIIKNYKKKNPVLIKPAIEAEKIKNILKENVNQNKKSRENFKNIFDTVKRIDNELKLPKSTPQKELINESTPTTELNTTTPKKEIIKLKPNELTLPKSTPTIKLNTITTTKSTPPIDDKSKEATKIQSKVRQFVAKKVADEKRKSLNSNPDDAKTVVETLNTATEQYNVNADSYKNLLDNYKHLPGHSTIKQLSKQDQTKIKGFMKALGIPPQTTKIDSLRKKIKYLKSK
jgi:hypothetical protein